NFPESELAGVLADLYLREQKYEQLLRDVPEGDRPGEIEVDVRLNRGLAQLALKRMAEAETTLEGALDRTQNPARLLTALARVKGAENDIAAAKTFTERALSADARYTEAWVLQGQLKRSSGDADGARKDFDKALEIDPGNSSAKLARAQLLIGQ